jgi:hypothetical protein
MEIFSIHLSKRSHDALNTARGHVDLDTLKLQVLKEPCNRKAYLLVQDIKHSGPDVWIIDPDANVQLCKDRKWFTRFRVDPSRSLHSGQQGSHEYRKGWYMSIERVGTLAVDVDHNGEDPELIIGNLVLQLHLRCKILSVSVLGRVLASRHVLSGPR